LTALLGAVAVKPELPIRPAKILFPPAYALCHGSEDEKDEKDDRDDRDHLS